MNVPEATYRVQLNKEFNFKDLKQIVPYLSQLGISHIYASPVFQAKKGSSHGYDIVDPNRISEELGGREAFENLLYEALSYGLEWMQDIVPNHQAYSVENKEIYDLLQMGQGSVFSAVFDVDWSHPSTQLKNRILAPFLSEPYSLSLKKGLVKLSDDGSKIQYNNMAFPLNTAVDQKEVTRYRNPALLEELLSNQHYALAYWKEALKQINYRRFFDIIDLIGVRVENPEVFEGTQSLILQLTELGKFSALRIDHIDGLYNPEEYLRKLREKFPDTYLIAEKILTGDEQMPSSWSIQGTTGYDFINQLNALFMKPDSEEQVDAFYRAFTGNNQAFSELLFDCKRDVVEQFFLGDTKNLARWFADALQKVGYSQNVGLTRLEEAIVELLACFPIYRTYNSQKKQDFEPFQLALVKAQQKNPRQNEEFSAIDFLFKQSKTSLEALHAIMRFQQFTGAVMAKGLEDTAFYRYNGFISANEVGGNPERLGCSTPDFHDFILRRQRNWPFSLNSTSTHDTKRGEDVRARLNVLSEIPGEFGENVGAWARINADKKPQINGSLVPSANEEYYLYQTLIGAYPWSDTEKTEFTYRLKQHMAKALREAKQNSSWLSPNVPYEDAVYSFIDKVFGDEDFMRLFLPFQRKIAFYGFFNTLSQILLKMTCPGVPDFYQGSELWNLNLVDPDNRRPVNYKVRQQALREIAQLNASQAPFLLKNYQDGKAKLYLISKTLHFRQKTKALFDEGTYIPLTVNGSRQDSVVAFMRKKGSLCLVVVVPRYLSNVIKPHETWESADWADTTIRFTNHAASNWINILTNQSVHPASGKLQVKEALADFPVALLFGADKE